MLVFAPITNNLQLHNAIICAFKGDIELIEKYHVVGLTLNKCVEDTYDKIIEAIHQYPLEMHQIVHNGEVIGYSIICKAYSFLYSFAINIEHRNAKVVGAWFDKVCEQLQNNFTCALWAKNTRAIGFLLRNGLKIHEQKNEEIHLKYN
jgi:hypothetical protein